MLLKHLYDFAVSRKLLDDLAFRRNTPVRWLIHLDKTGKLIGQGPQETLGSRPKKGHEYDVPKTTRATNSGTVADFLVDDIGAIFGLVTDLRAEPNARSAAKLRAKHEDFWKQIREALTASGDERFSALIAFHKFLGGESPSFLQPDAKRKGWLVTSANGEAIALGSDLLTFAVETPLFLDESVREYWRTVHAKESIAAEENAELGTCIITGETNFPLARTHTPMVTGLPKPAKGTGAGIVGFESDAFRSYGFEKSYNAPTSILASRGYLLALQSLSRNENHWLAVGPAWVCFWAVSSEKATNVFAQLLRKPDPLTVRKFLISPWAGLENKPPDNDKFISVTISASGPRIVIKSWLQMPLMDAAENLKRWFYDLKIETGLKEGDSLERLPALAVRQLSGCTAPLHKKGNFFVPDEETLRCDVVSQLYKAAIEGTAPSISLLAPILSQLHSRVVRDKNYRLIYDESRFALLKLILNRNRQHSSMEIQPTLTADTEDAAYNCGRLFAILAATQAKAHDFKLEGAGVAERYFGTASVSPSSVLPLLIRLNRHHLNKIRKSDRYRGHERFIQEQIEAVMVLFKPAKPGLPPSFPRTLDLQGQGRFALGFYQQNAAEAAARQSKKDASAPVA